MIVLPVYVGYEQNSLKLRLYLNGAKRMPALFSRFIYAVRTYKAALILEDQRRQLE